MRFVFKARDKKTGEVRMGRVDAYDKKAAAEALEENNLIPLSVSQERNFSRVFRELQRSWEGGNKKDIMMFFRQLTTLIGASVPVVQSLRAVASQSENKFMRSIIKEIADDVEDGASLSESMAKHPDIFSHLSVSIIKAGEISGGLQEALKYVLKNTEKNYRLAAKIKGALLYPGFVLSATAIIGFIVITVILPKITLMITELDIETPWYTKAVIATGDFMSAYWWAVLIVFFGAIGGFIYYIKTESGKKEWDQIKIKIPIIGRLFRYIYLSRFASNFSVLLVGGIPIVKALNIMSEVVDNSVYRGVILRSADEMKSGGNISSVFSRSPYIPSIVSKMVKIGEETGKMDESLKSIADFYDEEIENMTRNFSSLLEPVLIVLLGLGVAVMVFAIILPIYSIVGEM
ncbi:type II secretion system F family protein [bacterium]|nr:type II secretion system F family protein [bacterium]